MRDHLFEIYFDEMTMSILINMDEILYSASSCNVILERKICKTTVATRTKTREEQQEKKQSMLDYCLLQM